MATFSIGSALDALKVALDARGGMSGVLVATGPLGSDTPREAITFDRVEQNDDHESMGSARETMTIHGSVFVMKPGKDEAVIKSARDRALAILKELKDELNDDETISGTVTTSHFSGYQLDQDVGDPPARICGISFTIEAIGLDVE